MHKSGTSWPLETRVKLVVIYEELLRQQPRLSANRFCQYHQVPYSTFCRWLGRWRTEGRLALMERPRRPRRSPSALTGRDVTIIRCAHCALGYGVRRLYAHLRIAGLVRCSLSSVYRVLRRCGALVRRPQEAGHGWATAGLPSILRLRSGQAGSEQALAPIVAQTFRTGKELGRVTGGPGTASTLQELSL